MNTHEIIKPTGMLRVVVIGPDGQVKTDEVFKNLVVDAGKDFVASRMVAASATVMSHMGIGSDTTAPAAGNTTLGSQLSRVTLASASATGAVVTYTASFPAGTGTGAVTEAGIFNAAVAGTMLCRTVFSVVNKGANDSMLITWTVTVS